MTQRKMQAKTRDEMVAEFPVEGRLPGWYFRMQETSNNAWLVEGSDVWGRRVSRAGGDPDTLLAECIRDAADIAHQSED